MESGGWVWKVVVGLEGGLGSGGWGLGQEGGEWGNKKAIKIIFLSINMDFIVSIGLH